MDPYCVNRSEQTNGDHEVHNLAAKCPFEPAPSNQIALGSHATCRSAVEAAKSYYRQSNGCAKCSPNCHTG